MITTSCFNASLALFAMFCMFTLHWATGCCCCSCCWSSSLLALALALASSSGFAAVESASAFSSSCFGNTESDFFSSDCCCCCCDTDWFCSFSCSSSFLSSFGDFCHTRGFSRLPCCWSISPSFRCSCSFCCCCCCCCWSPTTTAAAASCTAVTTKGFVQVLFGSSVPKSAALNWSRSSSRCRDTPSS